MIQLTEDVSQWHTIFHLAAWANGNEKELYKLVIDIGANDGKRLSNSWNLIVDNGWKGILVEPVPSSFNRIKENYKDQPYQPEIELAAMSNSSQRKLLWVGGEDNMLSSFEAKPHDGLKEELWCDCITPQELFDKHAITHVGVLSVDTEGHDLPIIQSMIKETPVRPQIIITESWPHLYYDNIIKHSLLFNEGYAKILHCGENEIFYRRR